MINRQIRRVLMRRLSGNPAAALVGPRQCGKTTLARSLTGAYFDLEQEEERLRLDLEWPELLRRHRLIILDEAQAWPELFPRLRGAIDAKPGKNGRFLLLGSVSPALMTRVSESLAGRMALVELTPFTLEERPKALPKIWLCGGYPAGGVLEISRFPQWQHDYLAMLTQRDLPAWGLPAKPQVTQRLLRMAAAVHGQIWNASQIGQSLGLSYHTVNDYMDYLVGAFLIRRLTPYGANLKKRLVKSPKVYWRDSGLVHAILNVRTREDLLARPWVGASWEGFVIEQIIAALRRRDISAEPYFLRTSDQYEIDLILDFGRRLWAIEIKLTSSPGARDMARLCGTADMVKADRRILVSQTTHPIVSKDKISCNLPWLLEHLGEW